VGARQGGNIVPPPAQASPVPVSPVPHPTIPLKPQVYSPPVAQLPIDDGNDPITANMPNIGPDANPSPPRCSSRSNKGVAPTRLPYEVKGTPTSFLASVTFEQMITGLVSVTNQREHDHQYLLALLTKTDSGLLNGLSLCKAILLVTKQALLMIWIPQPFMKQCMGHTMKST